MWHYARAETGFVIVLDPKGELYDQIAHLFRNVYRIDLQKPERTDRWNFLPDCKENAEYAHKVASMILDSEQVRRSTTDPFWKEAEKAALTAILLHLPQLHPRAAPHMIQELISTRSLQEPNELMICFLGKIREGSSIVNNATSSLFPFVAPDRGSMC